MALPGGTEHEPGRYSRPCHAAGGQGGTRGGGAACSTAPGHAPEPAHAGHSRWWLVGWRDGRADLVAATAATRCRRIHGAVHRVARVTLGRPRPTSYGLFQAASAAARRAGAGATVAG